MTPYDNEINSEENMEYSAWNIINLKTTTRQALAL